MENFLQTLISFPVVPFTVLLGVLLVYWCSVIVGALGVDALDADGVPDGSHLGGFDGLDAHGHAEKPGDHGSSFFDALGLGGIPLTVALSFLVFFGFAFTLLGAQFLAPLLTATVPRLVVGSGILLGATVASVFLSRYALLPFRKVFVANEAPGRRSAILGKVCVISSTTVDARFGQATIDDGGAGIILNVFCKKPNSLKRGDRALVLDHSPDRDNYEIEPVEWLLPEELGELEDPARARALAALHRVR